jgi:hypothetical protein
MQRNAAEEINSNLLHFLTAMASCILILQMEGKVSRYEEQPQTLNMQLWTTDIGWSSNLEVGCPKSEYAFVITCAANLMGAKVLYVQQDLRYEISSYWRFSV